MRSPVVRLLFRLHRPLGDPLVHMGADGVGLPDGEGVKLLRSGQALDLLDLLDLLGSLRKQTGSDVPCFRLGVLPAVIVGLL